MKESVLRAKITQLEKKVLDLGEQVRVLGGMVSYHQSRSGLTYGELWEVYDIIKDYNYYRDQHLVYLDKLIELYDLVGQKGEGHVSQETTTSTYDQQDKN